MGMLSFFVCFRWPWKDFAPPSLPASHPTSASSWKSAWMKTRPRDPSSTWLCPSWRKCRTSEASLSLTHSLTHSLPPPTVCIPDISLLLAPKSRCVTSVALNSFLSWLYAMLYTTLTWVSVKKKKREKASTMSHLLFYFITSFFPNFSKVCFLINIIVNMILLKLLCVCTPHPYMYCIDCYYVTGSAEFTILMTCVEPKDPISASNQSSFFFLSVI